MRNRLFEKLRHVLLYNRVRYEINSCRDLLKHYLFTPRGEGFGESAVTGLALLDAEDGPLVAEPLDGRR